MRLTPKSPKFYKYKMVKWRKYTLQENEQADRFYNRKSLSSAQLKIAACGKGLELHCKTSNTRLVINSSHTLTVCFVTEILQDNNYTTQHIYFYLKTMAPTELYLVVNSSSFLSIKSALIRTRVFPVSSFITEFDVLRSSIEESLSVLTLTEGIEGNFWFLSRGLSGANGRNGPCLGEVDRQCGREEEKFEWSPASETTGQEEERLEGYAERERCCKWRCRGAEEEMRCR